jgi:hypothetical protein
MITPLIGLGADLNAEDDEGLNWSLLRDARPGVQIVPGAVVVAGVAGFWAVVRIVAVDEDGMVHFEQLSDDHPDARRVLAAAGDD